jgi:predicted AlkP superfamily phosphohydrolase/phosphomutase
MDAVVGDVAARLGPDDLLLIASDHGFQTWRRGVNVNQWLMNQGYLVGDDADEKKLPDWFAGRWKAPVDWSQTKAYAIGLGQVYLNVRGREPEGIVDPKDVDALAAEIRGKLLALKDVDGTPPLKDVIVLKDVYRGPKVASCGELQLAFDVGYRVSWQTALLGGMRRGGPVFEDNFFAWSGDHCSTDRSLVPGVLLSNQPLPQAPADRRYQVRDVAATVLERFGIAAPDLVGESKPLPLPPVRLAPAKAAPPPTGDAAPKK